MRKLLRRPTLVLGPSEDPRPIARVRESGELVARPFASDISGAGQSMKISSNKKSYRFGAFGGLAAVFLSGRRLGIAPARGAIAGLALVILCVGINAAHAFTDSTGATCDSAFVVTTNVGQFCSGGSSSSIAPSFANPKMGMFRDNPFPPGQTFDDFGWGATVGGGPRGSRLFRARIISE